MKTSVDTLRQTHNLMKIIKLIEIENTTISKNMIVKKFNGLLHIDTLVKSLISISN
jgi:hypothetical protein